jgi:hypothetical protein
MIRYCLRLPTAEYHSLKAFAKREGVSMSEIIRRAIASYLANRKERKTSRPNRVSGKTQRNLVKLPSARHKLSFLS